jgi:tRNA nucleotidyltransferase (CCA-adding enzyme)
MEIYYMVKNYQSVLREVLKEITPTNEEIKKLHSVAKDVFTTAKKEARKVHADVMLAGSITRDTWLPGKKEFDLFILFPPKLKTKELEKKGLALGKKIFIKLGGTWRIDYAQHPYVSGNIDGIEVDIVPSYNVKSAEQLQSAVDRTPFHVRYIEKKLKKNMSSQVRLLKQFLTSHNLYGADAKTLGFSGYVCELLVIKYKNFINVLKEISKWKPIEIIDIEKFYNKKEYHNLIKKYGKILILIDPTDKTRNTTAAVSSENFFKFIKLAKEFLQNPLKEYFVTRHEMPISDSEFILNQIQRRTELIFVKFKPPSTVPDILWPQLRRFAERLQSILEETRYEFKVLKKDVYSDEKDLAIVLLEMEVSKLPLVQKRIGPRVTDLDDSHRFLEKYKTNTLNGPHIENDFWAVEIKRKFISARDKIEDSLRKDAKTLEAKGIPNLIAKEISKEFEVFSESDKVISLMKENKNFGVFLKKFFAKSSLI